MSLLKSLIAKQASSDQSVGEQKANEIKPVVYELMAKDNAALRQQAQSLLAQIKSLETKLALYEKDLLKPDIKERLTLTRRNEYQKAYMRAYRAKRKIQQKQARLRAIRARQNHAKVCK